MPPLPSTYDDDTKGLIASVQRREKDISGFQIPRLRECRGPLSTQQNLAAELREDLDVLSRQIEALDVSVGDQKGERSRRELKKTVDEFSEAIATLRRDARAALLSSKRIIDSQSLSQREELLRSSALNEKQNSSEKVGEDALMKANDDVTNALRRTIGLMQGELERSVLTTQMLDASTANLKSTSSTHDTLTTIMGTSKQLITALEKSDWLDRLLLLSATIFFFLVVLFILKQRIVDRGLRIALWWTRFLPNTGIDFDKMEKGQAVMSSATAVASSVIASASTTLVVLSSSASARVEGAVSRSDSTDSATLYSPLSTIISTTEAARTSGPVGSSTAVRDEL